MAATFAGLDAYKMTQVKVTDRELGHGSHATVLELEYMGLKCAGKKIHEVLLKHGGASYSVHRFEEECRLLSQVRHPKIVQFLGVHFQQGVPTPILVMEYLPTNLTSCIAKYGILPKEISYSILHDVALGLCYLHSQTPSIIHRDLSANNVLLSPNMTAKISDLGVARIIDLTHLQVSRMTGTPGTPAYMPPEVMIANPKYGTSVDAFSYGILMIHTFSGSWPEPQVGPVRTESGKLIPVTEAERREVFLCAIGNDHPLMDLILKSIDNHPQIRAHAREIVKRLTKMVLQLPSSFVNRLEMLRQIEHQKEKEQTLRSEYESAIQKKEEYIQHLIEETQRNAREIDHLKIVHSIESKQLKLQVKYLKSQKQQLKAESEDEARELKSNAALYESMIENNAKMLQQEQEVNEKLAGDFSKSISKISMLQHSNSKLEAAILAKDNIILMKDVSMKRKDDEIDAKTKALQQEETTVSEMTEHLSKVREYLSRKQQVLRASITWKQCTDLPVTFGSGKATVINGKVYCGGGLTDNNDDKEYIVYCYDLSQDDWTTLPPLPVRLFGLDQVNGKLVVVGGKKKVDGNSTNDVFTYGERSRKWKQTLPPMLTARYFPGVLSLQSALVVAGGCTSFRNYVDTVEIFRTDTSQWYRTDRLPTACRIISPVVIGSTCYALGGYKWPSGINPALYASVDHLLRNAVPANQPTTHSSRSADTHQSAWKTLISTPTYEPAVAVLAGNLLALGGTETSQGGADKKEVYMFSPSTNSWIYISDLPEPRYDSAVAVLSSTEVLVIGGCCETRVNTVYKGTLTFDKSASV